MSSSSSLDGHLAIENFEPLMKKLVDQHCQQHENALSISISWQDDNTNATRDVQNFQAILRILGYSKAEEFIIPIDSLVPGWEVVDKIRALILQAMGMTRRTIIFIHYAGHGLNWNEDLHFCDASGRKHFNVDSNILSLVNSASPITDAHNIDVVLIFDSCYSYLATRGFTGESRVVEILAAVDEKSKLAFSPGVRASFTGKLYAEILRRKQLGTKDIELADLIAHLRKESPVKKPSYRLLVGGNSLRLTIPGDTEGSSIHPPPGPAIHAVFSFRLAKSLSIHQLIGFRDWVWKLPREIGLTLDAVYETESMTLMFRAPCSFWLKLDGYDFVELICQAKSDNLLLSIPASSTQELNKENINPNPASKSGRYCSY
ncbi:hypothetical protein BDV41DRAFT_431237 [Aspergillus transmontanensis]|uniref:Caspase domain-containing protein n=1 Tax=Aspergillus transmontanensis TaxID=1034304 RepID=A0A5N6VM60_9EURO|nr:hypothetical protein BDV41DRAFT_431237 [Aspergillus transmontanensis]